MNIKAIICPQCGALLEDILIEQNIARCDYCRANILIEQIGKDANDVKVSLTTRATGGKEDKEIYEREGFTFTKKRFQVNESLRLANISQRKSERARSFGIFVLILGIIIFVLFGIFLGVK
jgi:DNA-directed RNA polymerase subunit RPC12/RpoP